MSRIAIIGCLAGVMLAGGCQKEETDLPAPQAKLMETVAVGILGADENPARMGEAFVDLLVAQEFDKAFAAFDATMKGALPVDKLAAVWKSVMVRSGAFEKRLETETQRQDKYDVALITCQFEKKTVVVKVVFDGTKVSGLFFFPVHGSERHEWQRPAYADQAAFHERQVVVGKEPWALPGTLTLPKGTGPFPAVVLVHGSGPQDRDESIGANKPFKDLAWGLASQGVAVLRYEKRTKAHAAQMVTLKDTITTQEETVADAALAVDLLRSTTDLDPEKIFVLGHSLGGNLIPRIARAAPEAAGFISLAGNTRPLQELVLEQYAYLFASDGNITDEEKAELAKLKQQVARLNAPDLPGEMAPKQLPLGLPAAYWDDIRAYRPALEAKKMKRPLLVLQGGRDYQVTQADFDGWKKALSGKPTFASRLYPDLNHLFVPGRGKSTPKEYEAVGNVAKKVIDDIAAWVKTGKLPD